jgi:hypothetical protein
MHLKVQKLKNKKPQMKRNERDLFGTKESSQWVYYSSNYRYFFRRKFTLKFENWSSKTTLGIYSS